MEINVKTIGSVLVGVSIVLLFLLTFIKIDNDSKSVALCDAYNEQDLEMENCPVHKSTFSWTIIIAYGLGFVMLVIGVYLTFHDRLKTEEKKGFKKINLSRFNDEEKKCYEILKNNGGSSYQTDLIKETGYSKVKITRILDKLESMGILDRKRRGMTNIIVLK